MLFVGEIFSLNFSWGIMLGTKLAVGVMFSGNENAAFLSKYPQACYVNIWVKHCLAEQK